MTRKISIHRWWLEPVPVDPDGTPIPKEQWPRKRRHCWVFRWFGTDGDGIKLRPKPSRRSSGSPSTLAEMSG